MPSQLRIRIDTLIHTLPFFTTLLGPYVSTGAKRTLAAKLLLYEVRGRPWNSESANISAFDRDWTKWYNRPEQQQAVDRMTNALVRYQTEWVPGELLVRRTLEFPGLYWGIRWVSGIYWAEARRVALALYGQPSTYPIPYDVRFRYSQLRGQPQVAEANLERAQILMRYFAADRPITMPGEALVEGAKF